MGGCYQYVSIYMPRPELTIDVRYRLLSSFTCVIWFCSPIKGEEASPSRDAAKFENRARFLEIPPLGLGDAGGCGVLGWYMYRSRVQVLEEGGDGYACRQYLWSEGDRLCGQCMVLNLRGMLRMNKDVLIIDGFDGRRVPSQWCVASGRMSDQMDFSHPWSLRVAFSIQILIISLGVQGFKVHRLGWRGNK